MANGAINPDTGETIQMDYYSKGTLGISGGGSQYFRDTCEMCQVRLWKTTRTANQIKKSMYSEVEYTNPDLILYYPMNEGVGVTTLHDVTGNGHDVEIGNLNSYENIV